MKRMFVLSGLAAFGALSLTVVAAQQAPRPAASAIKVQKLADNLYVLGGGGGNTAAFITAGGVLLVDTKVSGWGQPMIDKLKTLTDKPVTTIVNTHAHFDHVNGNAEFPATVDIVTSERTKTLMEDFHPVYGLQMDSSTPFKGNGGKGLPKRTFKDRMTLGSGGRRRRHAPAPSSLRRGDGSWGRRSSCPPLWGYSPAAARGDHDSQETGRRG